MATFTFGSVGSQKGSAVFRFGERGLERVQSTGPLRLPRLYQVRDIDMLVIYSWLLSFEPITTLQQLAQLHRTLYRLFCVVEQMRMASELDSQRLLLAAFTMYSVYHVEPTPSAQEIIQRMQERHVNLHNATRAVHDVVSVTLKHDSQMTKNEEYETDLVNKVIAYSSHIVFNIIQDNRLAIDAAAKNTSTIDRICFEELYRHLTPYLDWRYESPLLCGASNPECQQHPLCKHNAWSAFTRIQHEDIVRIQFILFPQKVHFWDGKGNAKLIESVFPDLLIDEDRSTMGHRLFVEKVCGPAIAQRVREVILHSMATKDGLM